jgi:hypothetical protein
VNSRGVIPSVARDLFRICCIGACVFAAHAVAADEIGDALDASLAAQRAARESQQRVDRLDAETRALREKRRAAEARAQQLAAYAEQLEQEAAVEEQRRAQIEAELKRVSALGGELLPLARRMLAALEVQVARDPPFLLDVRRTRIGGIAAMLDDPQHSAAEKFRRALEAWRSEAGYGNTLGAEDAPTDCTGAPGASTRVRIGRVGFYCVADGQAARWDGAAGAWAPLDEDAAVEIARAAAMARGRLPPELLVLPVARP